jgi:hypothetical protein
MRFYKSLSEFVSGKLHYEVQIKLEISYLKVWKRLKMIHYSINMSFMMKLTYRIFWATLDSLV